MLVFRDQIIQLMTNGFIGIGNEVVPVDTNSTALNVPDNAQFAQIQVQDEPVRCWENGDTAQGGTAPTATTGQQFVAGSFIMITGWQNIKNFRAIQDATAGGAANLAVQYFKRMNP